MPPIRPFIVTALLCTGLAACALYAQRESSASLPPELPPQGTRFGTLTLLGAVEWRAARPDFGGFSGLALEEEGRFAAVTDKAHWARSRMLFDASGTLTGIEGLEMGRLNGLDGDDLMLPDTDSEALVRLPDGTYLIAFEHHSRLSRFETLRANEVYLPKLPGSKDLPSNGAFESLVALPDSRIVTVAESAEEWEKGYPGWIVDEHGDESEGDEIITRFTLAKNGWFAPTDMAMGPGGEWVYLLERRFTLIGGFAMRLSRFPADAVQPEAYIEPEVLGEITGPPLAENYEGLATARDATGRTVLYILSDDNFRAAQRTLLVQLRVEE